MERHRRETQGILAAKPLAAYFLFNNKLLQAAAAEQLATSGLTAERGSGHLT